MVKILVCGYGSIGKKHAQNLKKLCADIKIWRNREDKSSVIEDDGFVYEPSLDNGIKWCDGVVIATSTDHRLCIAQKASDFKKATYLEKPISLNGDGLSELVRDMKGLVVEIGCQMRQHPNLNILHRHLKTGKDGKVLAFQAWVGQRLDQWRPGTDYRNCYSSDASRGGGALFDLVHEIDLMTWLVGPMDSVYADLRHNSDLDIKAEDLANLILVSKNGAAGTVQLDMLSPAYRRGMQIICEKSVYKWDMQDGILWRSEIGGETVLIDKVVDDYIPADMLYDAMDNFLKRIKKPDLPASCSLEDGVHVLQILLSARKSNSSGCKQVL